MSLRKWKLNFENILIVITLLVPRSLDKSLYFEKMTPLPMAHMNDHAHYSTHIVAATKYKPLELFIINPKK